MRRTASVEARLVDLERPVARVPSLAIHLNRGVNTDGLVLNAQKHLVADLGLGKEVDLRWGARAGPRRAPEDVLGYDLCSTTRRGRDRRADEEFVYALAPRQPRQLSRRRARLLAADRRPRAHDAPDRALRSRRVRLAQRRRARRARCCATLLARIVDGLDADKQPQAIGRAMARSLLGVGGHGPRHPPELPGSARAPAHAAAQPRGW
jgi:aspartyl aminopeptidase